MEQKEIERGNKLIVEFMGIEFKDKGYSNKMAMIKGGFYFPNELLYHSNWDWLIPVVDNISYVCELNNNELYRKFYNGDNEELLIFRFPMDKTWELCIKFIEWYNKNKNI